MVRTTSRSTTGTVYGLYDPLSDRLVYVGATTQRLSQRLNGHMAVPSPKVREWIDVCRSLGVRPIIRPIHENVPVEDLPRLESEEIKANAHDHGLLNHHHGGKNSPKPEEVLTWLARYVWTDLKRTKNA